MKTREQAVAEKGAWNKPKEDNMRIHPNINTKRKKLTTKQLINRLTADNIDRAFLISALEYYSIEVLCAPDSDLDRGLWNGDLLKVVAQNTLDTLKEYRGNK